jgi:hypothetical protein
VGVLIPPSINNTPGFFQSVVQIAIHKRLFELTDGTFNLSILPWTSSEGWLYIHFEHVREFQVLYSSLLQVLINIILKMNNARICGHFSIATA